MTDAVNVASVDFRVTISGITTQCLEFSTRHDVDAPIATGSLVMLAPRPGHVGPAAWVRVEAANYNQYRTVFDGQIADDDAAFTDEGSSLRVALEGWGKRLWYPQHQDMTITGQQTLYEIARSICATRQVPYYAADYTTNPDGSTLFYGGNARVNGGNVTIAKSSSPGEVLERLARNYGYRVYDTPTGVFRLKRISGMPVDVPVRTYTEGVNLLSFSRSQTLNGTANYWEVFGARYTETTGAETAIRSIPATVPSSLYYGPSGVSRKSITDSDIVNQQRADNARNAMEIDYSTPLQRWTWTVVGDAEMSPGHVVNLVAPSILGTMTPLAVWVMGVSQSFTDDGWTTTMDGWVGGGQALSAGNDCVTQTLVGNSGFHLGNEYLAHYRRPNPDGITKIIPFSVTNGYSTLTISGYAHGSNSFVRNASSTASRFEIWQGGQSVASGEMPSLNENFERRLNYSINSTWDAITVPLSGSLAAGSAELRIIAGYDSTVGDTDDFEIRNLILRTCGIGAPVIL